LEQICAKHEASITSHITHASWLHVSANVLFYNG
jgi:hypothetical protein